MNVKCSCGHVSPIGISFCEHCGEPVAQDQQLLDMRYEGTARRSMKSNKSIIDSIWAFFSSVKIAVVLIILTLIGSAIGTIYPQQMYIPQNVDPATFYAETYGFTGELYYTLGFHDLYGTLWYMLLVASIGISLVVCSLDRVVPLYKALNKQATVRTANFMRRQRMVGESNEALSDDDEALFIHRLERAGYKVKQQKDGFLAEKNRFSRWGPYVNHIGLILFLGGLLLRSVPGMYADEVFWIREGETLAVPGTNGQYFVRNEEFTFETYEKENEKEAFGNAIDRVGSGNIPKNYETKVTWYMKNENALPGANDALVEVQKGTIIVNEPNIYDGYGLYQSDFKADELHTMSFQLMNKSSSNVVGTFEIDLSKPEKVYEIAEGYSVEIKNYYPDYVFDEGEIKTLTRAPNNPAFLMNIISPEKPKGEVAFIAIQQNIEAENKNVYKIGFKGITTRDASGLIVKLDRTLPILSIGGVIFMIGLTMGMYWHHRRLWYRKNEDGTLTIALHTNKNWYGMSKEIEKVSNELQVPTIVDKLDE
ncbi:MAG: cytochrome c biogenesis protein ResB [Bacilli bacterium]